MTKEQLSEKAVNAVLQAQANRNKQKYIEVAELRLALAEFSIHGVKRVTYSDFLKYLSGLAKDKEDDRTDG